MTAVADRVKETTTTTGTGNYSLAGAVTGFRTFVDGIGNGKTCYYAVEMQGTAGWEVGIGTVTDGTPDILARTEILASSNAGAAVDWTAGTKTIFVTSPTDQVGGRSDPANTPPNFSAFTWVNQGTSTRTAARTRGVPYEILAGAAAADVSMRLLLTTLPARPWTMEVDLSSTEPLVVSGNWRFGLCVRDSASSRYIKFGPGVGAPFTLFNSKFNSHTSFNSNYTSAAMSNSVVRYPIRLRMTDDDTNFRWYYSPDGLQWIQFDIARSRTDFTAAPDQIGLAFNSVPAATINNFLISHFRIF